jgi:YidC/Oxa1 family membrane protein insertase
MMDQKRLFLAIVLSLGILIFFQTLMPQQKPRRPAPDPQATAETAPQAGTQGADPTAPARTATGAPGPAPLAPAGAVVVPREAPRLKLDSPHLTGSISLLGARIDDIVLRNYRVSIAPDAAPVRLLEPRSEARPYYVQYGWSAAPGADVRVPDNDTLWTASAPELGPGKPVTLSWDNGAGVIFEIGLTLDERYMFRVEQRVRNTTGAPVEVVPWGRVRRDYKPELGGFFILFEGLIGVLNGKLNETDYNTAKSEAEKRDKRLRAEGKRAEFIAVESATTGGWAGITDKYWLTALIPDQASSATFAFRHIGVPGKTGPAADNYQADFRLTDVLSVPAGGEARYASRLFAGAKVVSVLQEYESKLGITMFDYAVDWGWFWFLTRPIFQALEWFHGLLGNFGLAILAFTVVVKLLFFPLANYAYRSMSKMKLLAPKMTELREQYKDNPQELQKRVMALYREEQVNPASGCLPIIVQIPVFFSLYKVIFVTIEMRQAPFYGWIKDLSAVDPTNVFNLFGLIPFDIAHYVPLLHVGAWPLLMGITMWLQMKLNPPPPDPMQARLFMLMPVVFTFMLAGFSAGLVIYWTWNNLLSIAQQWVIMRQTTLPKPNLAKTS